MGLQQFIETLVCHAGQCLVRLLRRLATDIVVVHKIGSCRNQEQGCCGIFNGDSFIVIAGYITISLHIYIAYSLQSRRDTFLLHAIDGGEKLGVIPSIGSTVNFTYQSFLICYLQLRCELHLKLQLFFLAGFQLHNNHIVGLRGKHRAFVFHTIIYIRGGSRCIAQVQRTLIFGHILMTQLQLHTTQRQKTHAVRPFHKVLVNKF